MGDKTKPQRKRTTRKTGDLSLPTPKRPLTSVDDIFKLADMGIIIPVPKGMRIK